ncbi:MAG: SDR family NAD(P)-dependent oxidoreductase, partial [Vicinamibacteria bacterium]
MELKSGESSPSRLRQGGVYLLTGGLGGIGLEIARFLARTARAKLVLTGRSELPPATAWDEYLRDNGEATSTSRKILAVRKLESLGAEVWVARADVSNEEEMRTLVSAVSERFGAIHGVVHAAGVAGGGLVQLKTREEAARVLAPKVMGTLVLERVLAGRNLDFLILCSSLASVVGGPGQVDYCGANAFLDAFARRNAGGRGTFTIAINWDTWREVGMAVETAVPGEIEKRRAEALRLGMTSEEGVEVFRRIVKGRMPQVLVSTRPLNRRYEDVSEAVAATPMPDVAVEERKGHERPELATPYVSPRSALEKSVIDVWSEVLGYAQVGAEDDFFDLGGHSLLATKVVSR